MEKVKLIIAFEYLSRVRRLSFIITTLLAPFLMLFALALPLVFTVLGSGRKQIVILDESGIPGLFEAIEKKTGVATNYTFLHIVVASDQELDRYKTSFNSEIVKDSGKSYLVLGRGIIEGAQPEFYGGSVGDFALEILARNISSAVIDQRLARDGIDAERYLKPVTMKKVKVSAKGEAQEGLANLAATYLIFMMTFLGIIGYGSRVMFGIIEEKHTRIIEVMLSSVKPFEMMMGKLIGIGLVGLTQYLLWVFLAVPIFFLGHSSLSALGIALNPIPLSSYFCFIIYFLLGYFLYASFYAIGGALATDNESTNSFTRLMSILTMLPVFTAPAVIQNPDGAIALTLSAIPFFTPATMVLRLGVSSPSLWQIFFSMFLMVSTIAAVTWAAAKIYRTGILIYGKKPRLPEIIRWLRYA